MLNQVLCPLSIVYRSFTLAHYIWKGSHRNIYLSIFISISLSLARSLSVPGCFSASRGSSRRFSHTHTTHTELAHTSYLRMNRTKQFLRQWKRKERRLDSVGGGDRYLFYNVFGKSLCCCKTNTMQSKHGWCTKPVFERILSLRMSS